MFLARFLVAEEVISRNCARTREWRESYISFVAGIRLVERLI